MEATPTTIGVEFARALAKKDSARLAELLHPEVDFRGLTPNYNWEAAGPDAVLAILFGDWFEDKDEIRALESVESDVVVDRQRVGYRFSVRNPDGNFLVEQQTYLTESEGRIDWMRVVCSGFRPTDGA